MKIKRLSILLLVICNAFSNVQAQINFEEQTELLFKPDVRSAMPIVVGDFDGDFKDDIVRFHNGSSIFLEYQRIGHRFEGYLAGNLGSAGEWMALAGDLDQDKINEILSGGAYNAVKILKKNEDNEFSLWQMTQDDFFAQGSNMADINNDGWLDLFVCDDDGVNEIWLNDGTGMLVEQDDYIDFHTVPVSDNSGNYGSEWIDIDMDHDLDLYIAKCRGGVTDPTDPRRVNVLYLNDGSYQFEEKAAEFGLAIGAQSWTTNFDDLDNDGDLDAFVVNHDAPYMILENQDSLFVDVSDNALPEALAGFGLQSVIRDFDNDGWSDILIGGDRDYILWNKGNMSFEIIYEPFGSFEAHSFGIGDLNDDGFWDVYTGHGDGINQSGLVDDALWLNQGNDNQFVMVSLLGDSSNLNAIGARLQLYGDFGIQTRTVRAGEGYGVCHSFTQIFGLSSDTTKIDSLVIYWPSGIKDHYTDIMGNGRYMAHEGRCLSLRPILSFDGNPNFCAGDSVTLLAPLADQYLWSTGETGQQIVVKVTGNYFVELSDASGCKTYSEPIYLIENSEQEVPEISFLQGDTLNCKDSDVILTTDSDQIISWSDGSTAAELVVVEPGPYALVAQGYCAELYSDTLYVSFLDPENPVVFNDTISLGESAILVAQADSVNWYLTEMDLDPVFTGDSLETDPLDVTTSYFARAVESIDFESQSIGQEEQIGNSLYAGDNINGQIIFSVFEDVEIQSVDVYTDTPAVREILILTQLGDVIFSRTFDIDTGKTVLPINLLLTPGNDYIMTTSTSLNLELFGHESPRLERSKEGTAYPYIVPGLLSLNDSNYGPRYYYYFFNWKVRKPSIYCISDAVEATAVVEISSSVNEIPEDNYILYPNPIQDILHLEFKQGIPENLRIFDINGKPFHSQKLKNKQCQIDVSAFPAGMYFLELSYHSESYYHKWIKQ